MMGQRFFGQERGLKWGSRAADGMGIQRWLGGEAKEKDRKKKRRREREKGVRLSGGRGRTVKNPTHLAGEDRPQVQLLWISNLF